MASIQGAQQFQLLAERLKEAGETGLRRELNKAIRDAAQPVADQIKGLMHLREYMPDRYADALAADLQVSVHARAGGTAPGITLFGRAPTTASGGRGGRKIRQRESGVITHPVFGDRRNWKVQTAGMKPGFFSDPAERSAPQVRDKIQEAMGIVADEITGRA